DVREMGEVGDVLAALVEAGANSVSSVYFTVDDPTALYDSAYADAVDDARDRAELLAESLGVTLGEAQSVSEWGSYYPYADATSALCNYGGGLTGYGEAPPVTPGSFTATASVQVSFSIE
ncbi:SIMPL domain-containing protein, partial [Candidatus Fermentibacterales bacterium]|nr:SIMPL domain-containing protein [Candidatus Fermentibacterales bacterium]